MSGERYRIAADAIRIARVLIITSGAGMGVDSGLPDFRGERGFWNAYPMNERLGLTFVEAENPAQSGGDTGRQRHDAGDAEPPLHPVWRGGEAQRPHVR